MLSKRLIYAVGTSACKVASHIPNVIDRDGRHTHKIVITCTRAGARDNTPGATARCRCRGRLRPSYSNQQGYQYDDKDAKKDSHLKALHDFPQLHVTSLATVTLNI